MEHQWKTILDSLGFVDNRKCLRCEREEIRENMPGHQGNWHARDYKPTPACIDIAEAHRKALSVLWKIMK